MRRRFSRIAGFAIAPRGLNLVGLKRAGFDAPRISILKQAYRYLYRSGLKLEEALTRIETEIPTPDTLHLVDFHPRPATAASAASSAGFSQALACMPYASVFSTSLSTCML